MKHFAIYFHMVRLSLDNFLVLEDNAAFLHSGWNGKGFL